MQREVNKIIEELAVKYDLSPKMVESIVCSPFEFVKKTIQSAQVGKYDTFKNVRIKNLGIFHVSKGKYNAINAKTKRDGLTGG